MWFGRWYLCYDVDDCIGWLLWLIFCRFFITMFIYDRVQVYKMAGSILGNGCMLQDYRMLMSAAGWLDGLL